MAGRYGLNGLQLYVSHGILRTMKLLGKCLLLAVITPLLFCYSFYTLLSHPPPAVSLDFPKPAIATNIQEDGVDVPPSQMGATEDIRVTALHRFLKLQQSPLADFTDVIVRQADLNGFDYALLPAISMQESGGCKKIPSDSHNCWGYGIYGSKITTFDSYPTAIAKVAKTIKETYIKNGYTNPTLVEDRWTPSSKGEWSYSVNYYTGVIHSFEK